MRVLAFEKKGDEKVLFEPVGDDDGAISSFVKRNGLIRAKSKCNSQFLKSDVFPERWYNPEFVRDANENENKEYIALKKKYLRWKRMM
jgi:hypothetical protein